MPLTTGTRLGPYEIVAPIGAGGMGEVYRARDTNLKRAVAIKVLPASVAADAERLARFQREAEVLAALNHPNIAHIHGLERTADLTALVMELVEGDDLSVLIARGPIPLAEALPIAKQIADALEAAHERGIIHRDLKPANIKVRPDGTVKVLDFGLAKALGPEGSSATADAANSPTLTARGTELGMILGTAAYMAPEQAKGRAVDRRADIWAFGVVLHEMLTGRRLFQAEDVSETLAAVLTREVSQMPLPVDLPARLRALVRDCLIRDPRQRLRDIGDARLVLDKIIAGAPDDVVAPAAAGSVPAGRRNRERLAWIMAATLGVALVVTGTMTLRHLREAAPAVDQYTISAEENSVMSGAAPQLAISPDGRQVAFVASLKDGDALWVRSRSTLVARNLPGTDGATYPFWSPDSRFIGFFAGGKLKKVPAEGGTPVVLGSAPSERGGAWNGDVILVSPTIRGPLQRVSADGTMTPVTTLAEGEESHRWPTFLPDGRHFLYFVGTGNGNTGEIRVGSLDSKEAATKVVASESNGLYAEGHVLFVRGGNLMALPFNADTRQSTSDALPVVEQVAVDNSAYAAFSVATTGVLTYARGSRERRLMWFEGGKSIGTVGDPGEYNNISLSRDKPRAAVSLRSGSPANADIWQIDLASGGAPQHFTFDPAQEGMPVWSPDSTKIAFSSDRSGRANIWVKAADGRGQEDHALPSATPNYPTDWSPDGNFLAYTDHPGSSTGVDLWVLPLSDDSKPWAFLKTSADESNAVFSPDGRWIAYDSNETGTSQIYVRPFTGAPGQSEYKYQISLTGGLQPMWRGDKVFFLAPDGMMMSKTISTAKDFVSNVPEALFPTGVVFTSNRHLYAVRQDGKRFLVIVPAPRTSSSPITVVVNWLATLQK